MRSRSNKRFTIQLLALHLKVKWNILASLNCWLWCKQEFLMDVHCCFSTAASGLPLQHCCLSSTAVGKNDIANGCGQYISPELNKYQLWWETRKEERRSNRITPAHSGLRAHDLYLVHIGDGCAAWRRSTWGRPWHYSITNRGAGFNSVHLLLSSIDIWIHDSRTKSSQVASHPSDVPAKCCLT